MKKAVPILIVIFIALSVRVAADIEFKKFPVFDHPQLDEMEYDGWANEIAGGKFLWSYIPIHSPGYAFFLAFCDRFLPRPYLAARLIQAAFSSLNVLLIFFLARGIFDERAALISAGLAAFFWPFVYFQARLLPGTLNLFFMLLSLAVLLSLEKRPVLAGFLSGLLLGASAVFWPLTLALAPALLIWFWLTAGFRKFIAQASVFILGFSIPILPISCQNYRAEKSLVLLQKNFGLNFYLGNNPDSNGTPYLRPGGGWDRLQAMPIIEAGIEKASEQNRFYINKWRAWAKKHPGSWLNLLTRKTKLLFDNREIIASFDPNFYRRRMVSLRACPVNSALVLTLSLIGLFSMAAGREKLALIAGSIFCLGLALILTLISSRYRLGFMSLALIPAGYGITEIYDAFKSEDGLRFWGLILAAAAFCALSLIPLPKLQAQSGYEWVHLGQAWKEAGNYYQAGESFRTGLNFPDSRAGARLGLAQLAIRQGRLDNAFSETRASLSIDPGNSQAHVVLGSIMMMNNDAQNALQEFRTAISLRPQYVYGWAGYANALIATGQIEQAEKATAKLALLRPDLPDLFVLRAKMAMARGDKEESLSLLKSYLKSRPDDPAVKGLVQELEKK